jgi:hypothetical protein
MSRSLEPCARRRRTPLGGRLARPALLILLALALALALRSWSSPAIALADFAPAHLVSGSPSLLASVAEAPAISEDGRYVAFAGAVGGVKGVYRKDLQSGELELVAPMAPDAGAPSISADGRYVAFTTAAALLPEDTNGCRDVYVRDMSLPASAPGALTLASSPDGTAQALEYEPCAQGSAAAGQGALSADGHKVVFTVGDPSNLLGGSSPTPGAQVAVRDLVTDTTTLVSVTRDPATDLPTGQPVLGGGVYGATATISANGSTVAWLGSSIADQAPTLPGEEVRPGAEYVEPLWRRIDAGPLAPTRRVTGGGDPSAPGCAGEEVNFNAPPTPLTACYGPFNTNFTLSGSTPGEALYRGVVTTPRLSADGQLVAIVSGLPPTGANTIPFSAFPSTDAYVVNMAEGLTRRQALRQLTLAAYSENPAASGAIEDIAISPDGRRVAFTTERTDFPLSEPVDLAAPLGSSSGELYEVNLEANTLERVTQPYNHEASDGPASDPSFTADDNTLAFASTASNLVYGDVNGRGAGLGSSEVFTASEAVNPAPVPATQSISPIPTFPAEPPDPQISSTASALRDGSVLVYVHIPSAGKVTATAQATLPITVRAASAGHKASDRATRRLASVTLAHASAAKHAPGLLTLHLRPSSQYHAFVAARTGVYAAVSVQFRSSDGDLTFSQRLAVTFRALPARGKAKKAPRARKSRSKKASGAKQPGAPATRRPTRKSSR